MSIGNNIGLSRKQRVFVVLEDTPGTLQWPNATLDFVRPAGNAVINQAPTFSDSQELENTLDTLDQFQDAMPPGEFTLPLYIRPSGTLRTAPQGAPLLQSIQGGAGLAITAALATAITTATIATMG